MLHPFAPFLAVLLAGAPTRAQEEEAVARELRARVANASSTDGPGGLLAVLRRGEPTFVETFGLADVERRQPITRDTVFYLASVAKQFTAACVLHAAADGKLALDQPVTRHVDGLPQSLAAVRLRDLVQHRSGIPDVYDLAIGLDLGREVLASNRAAVELLARLPHLDSTPGTRFRYSNSGYVLLAEALRAATGQALPAYARAVLFTPLGMAGARFAGEPELDGLPRARCYQRAGEAWRSVELPTALVGPGGLWAGLDDLARWERAAFEGGFADSELRARLVALPELGTGAEWHPVRGAYGAGLMIGTDRGLPVVRSAGEAFGFSAEILRYPEQELSIVVLTNGDLDLDDLAEEAAGVMLGEEMRAARMPAAPVQSAPADLARFGRFWRDEDSGVLWVLTLRPERMTVASIGDWRFDLEPAGPDRLVSKGTRAPAALVFEPATGPATRMRVQSGGVEVARCRPHPFPPVERAELGEYAGEYRLAELDCTLTIQVISGGLRIVQERPLQSGPPFVLPPFQALGEDLFACDAGAQMQFLRDEEGEVTALRLDLNRALGLVLVRT